MASEFVSVGIFLLGGYGLVRTATSVVRRTLNETAARLGFEVRSTELPHALMRMGQWLSRVSAFGVIDGHQVQFDRRARLREFDKAPRGGVRVSVRFDALQQDFRLTTRDYADSTAVELSGMPQFVVETDAPLIVEKIFTMNRRRIVGRMFELWPIFEVRHDRLIIVVPGIDSDPQALEEAIMMSVQAAKAFTADRYPL